MSETFTEAEVYRELLEAVMEAGTQKALAAKLGISDAYVSDCMRRNRPIRGKLLRHIGFERQMVYVASPPPSDQSGGTG